MSSGKRGRVREGLLVLRSSLGPGLLPGGAAFFYTGMEGLDMAQEAIGDILQ